MIPGITRKQLHAFEQARRQSKKSVATKKAFNKLLYTFHASNSREVNKRALPWRKRVTPYRVFISEIMLQQTQTERVAPKFLAFCKAFPTFQALAKASFRDVLTLWQGLGYNRRARNLHQAAIAVATQHRGKLPKDFAALCTLPGVGPYTAGAIQAFAFNQPAVFIETNIREVFLRLFFPRKKSVSDKELLPLIEAMLDHSNPRLWYSALMDFGNYLKKTSPSHISRSSSYAKQSRFHGSDRQVRGAIIRVLTSKIKLNEPLLFKAVNQTISTPKPQFTRALQGLLRDRLMHSQKGLFHL